MDECEEGEILDFDDDVSSLMMSGHFRLLLVN